VNVAQPFNEDQESSANSRANSMKDVALKQNYEQLTASLLNSGLYDSDDLLGAVRDNPLTVDMDPSEIGDEDVKRGLDQIGNHLFHRADGTLNYTDTRKSSFNDGYETAKPSNGEAPGYAWGG